MRGRWAVYPHLCIRIISAGLLLLGCVAAPVIAQEGTDTAPVAADTLVAADTPAARPAPAIRVGDSPVVPLPVAADEPTMGDGADHDAGFPDPLWWALLIVVLAGAAGAFASDIVTDGGRIEKGRREETGWALGFIGKMVVGAVAALILLTLNPPNDSWARLIGTALSAGLGGEAILLAMVASRKAQEAESERDQARTDAARAQAVFATRMDGMRSVALAAISPQEEAVQDADLAPGGAPKPGVRSATARRVPMDARTERIINEYADNALREISAAVGRG